RGEPDWESAGIVLEKDREEALDGAEQRAVDHGRLLAGAVCCRVFEREELRLIEIELNRRQLPCAADRVARLHRDLRPVERGTARIVDKLKPGFQGNLAERLCRSIPRLIGADELLRILCRELEVEVVEPVTAQRLQDELKLAGNLWL